MTRGFQPSMRLALLAIGEQHVDLRRAEVLGIDVHEVLGIQPDFGATRAPRNSRTECVSPVPITKSSALSCWSMQPHGLDVVRGMSPVALRVEVAEVELLLQPVLDAADGARDLARDERLAAALGLVVEEDAVTREHAVGLAVVLRDVERVGLGRRVGAARVERRRLALRRRGAAVELARARLVDADWLARASHGLEHAHRAEPRDLARVLGRVEGHAHVALRAEVVDLVGLHRADDRLQARRVVEIAVVEPQPAAYAREDRRRGGRSGRC